MKTLALRGMFGLLVAAVMTLAVAIQPAQAQWEPPTLQLTLPTGQSRGVPLQPGESATVSIQIRNLLSHARGEMLVPILYVGGHNPTNQITISPEPGSRCSSINAWTGITISHMAADEVVICTALVTRQAGSRDDVKLQVCTFNCNSPNASAISYYELLLFGELPDLALASEQVSPTPFGATTAIVRLTASNLSNRPLATQVVESECIEFGGGFFHPAPFDIENDFPGACPTATDPSLGGVCGNFGGQNYSNVKFLIGPLAAHGSASCELRLRFTEPLAQPVWIRMMIRNTTFNHSDGSVGFDAHLSNNEVRMTATPAAAYQSVPVPLLSRELLALIAGLLLAAGVWQTRALGRRR